MTYQLRSFKVLQTSVMAGALYFVLSVIILVPVSLIMMVIPNQKEAMPFGAIFGVLIPFLYAILGFVFTALGCLLYNLLAKFMGGFAFTIEETK